MPEISRFLGIVIGMFFNEHGVPHFHAVYGDRRITVEIDTGTIHGDFRPAPSDWSSSGWSFIGRNCSTTGNERGSISHCSGLRRWSKHP
jgi:Domain of unknown function (DUF4160)